MKRFGIFNTLFLVGLLQISSVFASEKVAMDLIKYVNQELHNIAAIEKKSLEQYASVIGENYTTDDRVYNALNNEVIPMYNRFFMLLKEISPKTVEVRELHQIYVRAAASMNEGFKMKKLGLEMKDDSVIKRGNHRIEKGRNGIERWKEQLTVLCNENGVTQEK